MFYIFRFLFLEGGIKMQARVLYFGKGEFKKCPMWVFHAHLCTYKCVFAYAFLLSQGRDCFLAGGISLGTAPFSISAGGIVYQTNPGPGRYPRSV